MLSQGRVIYGVNTGFGGSADTRTTKLELLQSSALQQLNVGILLPSDRGGVDSTIDLESTQQQHQLFLNSHAMPVPI